MAFRGLKRKIAVKIKNRGVSGEHSRKIIAHTDGTNKYFALRVLRYPENGYVVIGLVPTIGLEIIHNLL